MKEPESGAPGAGPPDERGDVTASGIEPPRTMRRRSSRFLIEAARSVLLTLLVFLVVRAFLVEAFKIPTSSMEGTLLAGDFLLVNKAVYGTEIPGFGFTLPALAEPSLGEVIVFHPPHEPEKHYVKRLVGMPGDTLEMRAKALFRNGAPVAEPYVRHIDPDRDAVHPGMGWQTGFLVEEPRRPGRYRPTRDNWGPLVLPTDGYFVLGDNRDNSEDSRYWGLVDRGSIKGRPWIVYYSSGLIGSVGLPAPSEIRWDRIGGRVQ